MTRENFIYNLHRKEMNYMTLPEQNFATRFAPLSTNGTSWVSWTN